MRATLLTALLCFGAIAGCLADEPDDSDDPTPGQVLRPPMQWNATMLPDPVTGVEHLLQVQTNATTGIWVEDDLAYLSGGAGLRIYDIADPAESILISEATEGTTGSRDVDLLHHENGRLYAVMAHGGHISLTDVTDPFHPDHVVDVDAGAHNIAVVPDTMVVYNSRSISTHALGYRGDQGPAGQIDMVDFTDPGAPVVHLFQFPAVIQDPNGAPKKVDATTCHDITFYAPKSWAYCPGVTETHIWDVSEPLDPQIIQVIDNPATQIHHGAWGAREGNLLILGDEFGGAAAGPNCLDPVPNPYAALWFIDISNLGEPIPVGYYQISYNAPVDNPDPRSNLCTTHFGTVIEERDLFTIGWYHGGTAVIDFSNPMLPEELAHFLPEGTNAWEARYYKGHIYTGDTSRGMDILRLI